MQAELYDALIDANASKEKARAAAKAAATISKNYPKPRELVTKNDIKAELYFIRWMLGINFSIALAALLYNPS